MFVRWRFATVFVVGILTVCVKSVSRSRECGDDLPRRKAPRLGGEGFHKRAVTPKFITCVPKIRGVLGARDADDLRVSGVFRKRTEQCSSLYVFKNLGAIGPCLGVVAIERRSGVEWLRHD
jgi:hypothetical protein